MSELEAVRIGLLKVKYVIFIAAFFGFSSCENEEEIESDSIAQTEIKTEKKKDMSEFWDNRYSSEEYVYGIEPNNFFRESLRTLEVGEILLPAEGEGRNAVYAALQGWNVKAFDISSEGKNKADKLASDNSVSIDYKVAGFDEFIAPKESFDVIALIYAHVPASDRKAYYQKCVKWLKPGGTLILEGFSKKQLGLNSGGPKSLEMLFSLEELTEELEGLTIEKGLETKITLSEGAHHTGEGEVVRIIATKPA